MLKKFKVGLTAVHVSVYVLALMYTIKHISLVCIGQTDS